MTNDASESPAPAAEVPVEPSKNDADVKKTLNSKEQDLIEKWLAEQATQTEKEKEKTSLDYTALARTFWDTRPLLHHPTVDNPEITAEEAILDRIRSTGLYFTRKGNCLFVGDKTFEPPSCPAKSMSPDVDRILREVEKRNRLYRAGNKEAIFTMKDIKESLKTIDLKAAEITRLGDLMGFTKLVQLDLSKNELTSLELSGLPALSVMEAKLNHITWAKFKDLPALTFLSIACNPLTKLETDTPALKYLDLHNTDILSVSDLAEDLVAPLTHLNIFGTPAQLHDNATSTCLKKFTKLLELNTLDVSTSRSELESSHHEEPTMLTLELGVLKNLPIPTSPEEGTHEFKYFVQASISGLEKFVTEEFEHAAEIELNFSKILTLNPTADLRDFLSIVGVYIAIRQKHTATSEPAEDDTEPIVTTETNVVGIAYVDTVKFYEKPTFDKLAVEGDISVNLEDLFDPEQENKIPEATKEENADENAEEESLGCSIFVKFKIGKPEPKPVEEEDQDLKKK